MRRGRGLGLPSTYGILGATLDSIRASVLSDRARPYDYRQPIRRFDAAASMKLKELL